MTNRRPVVIVGAGPAGMSAAITLASLGVATTVIDANESVGGQIYRQPRAQPQLESPTSAAGPSRGAQLIQQFRAMGDQVEFLSQTKVWGVFNGRELGLVSESGCDLIEAEQLLLATGAYEFVPPFPGWTLPGVMTPGCAQLLVKAMNVRPDGPLWLAGTGPFLLVVASNLLDVGVEVSGIIECVTRRQIIKALPGMLNNLTMLRLGWQYLRKLRAAGIPIHTGHTIVAATGDDCVRHVSFAPCDRNWRPDRSQIKTVDVTTLCVGYGFVPRTDLARLAGCELRWLDHLGGWVPVTDANFATTTNGVWVAGDGAGVAGATTAEAEGSLAGLAIARNRGAIGEQEFQRLRRPLARQLKRLSRFRDSLDKLSTIRPGLTELATADTIVCRCEELQLADVEPAIASGCHTHRTIKSATRLGMGPCQGRMCWPAMARLVASRTDRSLIDVEPRSVRPPIEPLTVAELATLNTKLAEGTELE